MSIPDAELPYPTDRYGLIHRAAALASGFTDRDLRSAVKSGRLERVTKGTYLAPAQPDRRDAAAVAENALAQFRLRSIAVATLPSHAGATVLSHASAAVLHGLPMLKPALTRVHLTNGELGGGRVRQKTLVHTGELPAGDIDDIDGVAVTGLARTAADVAQSSPPDDALAFARALTVFDAALRAGVEKEALEFQLAGRRRRGTRVAKAALQWADKDAESVGESWGRAQMIQAGLPVPSLQSECRVGRRTYRVDGLWADRLVWEFDGHVKYGRYRRPGESAADAVWREKQREDALRGIGLMVVRSVWSDLEQRRLVPKLAHWLDHFDIR
ncbi:hypothetical protein GOHSU_07_00190 [Gordonia hirsuta DSM 44140 = NBRC 16056]|uniref:AbiEi antitoxin N-terminal domain-containing protein n=1 Tax=Gordonia hirsuta DSM 44140 = NBRC 16056 TaxID=1121927 RepID=L7L5S4_9ACTN|nr:type IV toxin-antitoxin system AbiEi family antitoxin domain-containing protein [Gordonia hirsuta]GAC56465.1 hypothetical protein GOHSU_07_00190 [Gordonia hirsuta DSM 44140 = NBRC 16056]